jgi:hypothetical protein
MPAVGVTSIVSSPTLHQTQHDAGPDMQHKALPQAPYGRPCLQPIMGHECAAPARHATTA